MPTLGRKLEPGQGVVVVEAPLFAAVTTPGSRHGQDPHHHAGDRHEDADEDEGIGQSSHGKAMFADLAFQYPLKLMPPKIASGEAALAPGLVALYMLTYGGGLVSGDSIDLQVHVKSHSHLVLLTQGNTKVFRERPGGSYHPQPLPARSSRPSTGTFQRMTVKIDPNASLFLLPAPVTCFERASYSQRQEFHLSTASDSSLLLLDWFTSGRMSRDENWAFDKYRSTNTMFVDGKKVVNDVLLLEGADMAQRMARYPCYCTLFIHGQPLQPLLGHFANITAHHTQYKQSSQDDVIWSFSELVPGSCGVVRCAGLETEAVKLWLEEQLVHLKPIIGSDIFRAAFV